MIDTTIEGALSYDLSAGVDTQSSGADTNCTEGDRDVVGNRPRGRRGQQHERQHCDHDSAKDSHNHLLFHDHKIESTPTASG